MQGRGGQRSTDSFSVACGSPRASGRLGASLGGGKCVVALRTHDTVGDVQRRMAR